MQGKMNRRQLLYGAAGGALAAAGAARAQAPGERLNVACIGVGGRGIDNVSGVSGENIVALCDVDANHLAAAAKKHPNAALYSDWRRMLERKDIDAVVVSTPDHQHALCTAAAMQTGRHVYCEKPLTRTVSEAKIIARLTADNPRLATQMGTQAHSSNWIREVVEALQCGVLGKVDEVHAWSDRPIWPQGMPAPSATEGEPVPPHLNWDLWLGPAAERAYHAAYHPFKWRGFWDFGTGALGDMACHILDPVYWALDLGQPLEVWAEGPDSPAGVAPAWEVIHYRFPERGEMPAVKLTWYDGKKLPSAELFEGAAPPSNGVLFVGEKGKMLLDYATSMKLLPEAKFAGWQPPAPSIPRVDNHHLEWIRACKSGSSTGSHFKYATALTGMVLLGTVAYRMGPGKRLLWDGSRMEARNPGDTGDLLSPAYRKGWELK